MGFVFGECGGSLKPQKGKDMASMVILIAILILVALALAYAFGYTKGAHDLTEEIDNGIQKLKEKDSWE